MITETHMKELLTVALQAAKSARELILSYYNGDFDIEIKADQTPVTVADRRAEQVIRKTINDAFPEHGIFGEEYGAESKDTEYLWLVPHRRHQELCKTLRYVLHPDRIDAQRRADTWRFLCPCHG